MSTIINWIKHIIESIPIWLKEFGLWILELLYGLLQSILFFIVDAFCSLIEWLVAAIDFKNDLFDATLSWASLEPQTIYVLNQCGFDNGLIIITAAITIRLLLNLIPAALTRV